MTKTSWKPTRLIAPLTALTCVAAGAIAPQSAFAATDPAKPSISIVPVTGLQTSPSTPLPLRVDASVTNVGEKRGTFTITAFTTTAPFLNTDDKQFNGMRLDRNGTFVLKCLAGGPKKRTCTIALGPGENVRVVMVVDRQWKMGADGAWGSGSNRITLTAKSGAKSDSDLSVVQWGPPIAQAGVNGCGSSGWTARIPDRPAGVSFTPACDKHDDCYGGRTYAGRYTHYRNWKSRKFCEDTMLQDALRLCGKFSLTNVAALAFTPRGSCQSAARAYYIGLRKLSLAEKAYRDPHVAACSGSHKDVVNPKNSPDCEKRAKQLATR
jgi:hypothetical protein